MADPVGLAQIADRLGRPYNTVKKWRQRYAESWPKPRGMVGNVDWYEWEDIKEWCRKMGWGDMVGEK